MNETDDNTSVARIDALEAKVDAVLGGLAAQIANLSQSAQDAQPGVCIHTGTDPFAFIIADCAAGASSKCSGSEGMDACSFVSDGGTQGRSAWELDVASNEDGTYSYTLKYCYYNRAGVSRLADDMPVDVSAVSAIEGIVAVKFVLVKNDEDDNTSGDGITAKLYASIDEVNALQDDPNIYVVPLYLMISATEWVDLRTSVQLQVFDFAEF